MKYITLFWAYVDLAWLIAVYIMIGHAIWTQAWVEGTFWALMLITAKLFDRK